MRRKIDPVELDELDRLLINELQGGFPLSERPFADVAERLGSDEETVLSKIKVMREKGVLSRFGPMYHAERMGGGLTLAALSIPEDEFDRVNDIVNGFDEVAHNYKREHELNMWFVLATETPERVQECCDEITEATGYQVYNMPKKQEFFIGLRFEA
ncbi:AsnC family transcriptional regulator [Terasakiella sp. A23]|uniref:Lrp/AsnC family transcriptional regulator n=1 Tax=Terasakiella sp. FCG-A23 TaxID=3080561 RepID=UPI00295415D2|nr:AsnC family transcriptional regulator [Terasakiella sp. A23]MDV7341285.1 AsnC family transcriptional regulator [Terasakiella sp. A23]